MNSKQMILRLMLGGATALGAVGISSVVNTREAKAYCSACGSKTQQCYYDAFYGGFSCSYSTGICEVEGECGVC